MTDSREHWLDRLARAQHTRPQALRAVLAGAAALTLPLGRPPGARAVPLPESLCKKGCLYANERETSFDLRNCTLEARARAKQAVASIVYGAVPLYGVVATLPILALGLHCHDSALLESKERAFACSRPGCPGFDPAGEFGPCANCATIKGCQCCPDSSSGTGYTYCDSIAGRCCSPSGGCKGCGK